MTEIQFYNTTPRTFANIVKGYQKKLKREAEKEELQFRLARELHREQLYFTLLPHLAKKDRVSLEKFMPLPWDKKKESKKPKSKEEILAYWAAIDAKEKALKEKKKSNE